MTQHCLPLCTPFTFLSHGSLGVPSSHFFFFYTYSPGLLYFCAGLVLYQEHPSFLPPFHSLCLLIISMGVGVECLETGPL